MPDSIRIKLDTGKYVTPTQEDIEEAKNFILEREQYATILGDRVDDVLTDAAERIVTICYKYNVDPKKLYIASGFNKPMMDEISEVMDDTEEEIIGLIEEYSTRVTNDRTRINALLLWMATLGRGSRNLRDTLDGYLFKFMKDMEAAVSAMMYAGLPLSVAVTRAKTYLHSIYTMPEVRAAFKEASTFAATYIRSRGVQKGAVGISNNGSTSVTNMAKITLQMTWMREKRYQFEENGAAGYYVLRGSSYLCGLCDSKVGFHKIDDEKGFPPYHGHCCCYVIPIHSVTENKGTTE